MTPATHTDPTVWATEVLERAVSCARGSLSLVRPADADLPTPCAEWTLEDLLMHMDDSLAAFSEAAELGLVHPDPEPPPEDVGAVLDSIRDRACRLLGGWTSERAPLTIAVGGLPMGRRRLAVVAALEISVHAWDVRAACGDARPIGAALAQELLPPAIRFVTARDRPGRFGPIVPVTADASAGTRLLAYLGRRSA